MANISQKSRVIIVLCTFVLVFLGLNYWTPFTSKSAAMGEIEIRSNMDFLTLKGLTGGSVFSRDLRLTLAMPPCYSEHAKQISENSAAMRKETNWLRRLKLTREQEALHRAREISCKNDLDEIRRSK